MKQTIQNVVKRLLLACALLVFFNKSLKSKDLFTKVSQSTSQHQPAFWYHYLVLLFMVHFLQFLSMFFLQGQVILQLVEVFSKASFMACLIYNHVFILISKVFLITRTIFSHSRNNFVNKIPLIQPMYCNANVLQQDFVQNLQTQSLWVGNSRSP